MKLHTLSILVLGALVGQMTLAQSALDDYPLTLNGKRRVVVQLSDSNKDRDLSAQWRLAKLLPDSDCNRKVVIPELEAKTLPNSDLSYIEVVKVDILSTMMGCSQPGKPEMIFSDSFAASYPRASTPLVIYVETGVDVQARAAKAVGPFNPVKGN